MSINPLESTAELTESPSFFGRSIDRDEIGTSTNMTEHKQPEQGLQHQTAREQLLGATAQRIRQSLDLETILNQTVTELQQFLSCDRVIINRFETDGSGIIVVESTIASGCPL
ncbi:MAG: GAF domain-containing protein, partial [Scytonema sp. CRU_2_7]|nr:GAF domain-containing protein [Scytonema sp. CRU_2_7]